MSERVNKSVNFPHLRRREGCVMAMCLQSRLAAVIFLTQSLSGVEDIMVDRR